MPARETMSPRRGSGTRLHFDRYILDLDRGSLLCEGKEIALRPKTFAVLQHLIEHGGRLVSKGELFAAVWPNLCVTDDTLVQSIGEIRRALGTAGASLLKTVSRRGYRLDVTVTIDEPAIPRPTDVPPPPHEERHDELHADTPAMPLAPAKARSILGPALGALGTVAVAAALWIGIGKELKPAPATPVAKRADVISTVSVSRPAIAVLPFLNQNDNPARSYLADGLTQDIINALGRFPELTVISWNAMQPHRGKQDSPGQIGRNLAVDYQVEGSIVHNGERVSVLVQFVDRDGRVRWSLRFEEALSDFFVLQGKITTEIAGTLAIRLSNIEQQRALSKPTSSLEAYDCVIRARAALQRPNRSAIVEARSLLRRAIEIDPGYAAAYAALAENSYSAVSMGWAESPVATLRLAEDMANKALGLDGSDVRALIVLGRIRIFFQQYEQAKTELSRALAINPNDANALAGYGNILMWLGQTDAAIEVLERAQRLDPELNPLDGFALGLGYYVSRRYGAAIAQAEFNLRKAQSAHFNHAVLAAAFAQQNRPDDVDRVVTDLRRRDPTFDPRTFGSKFLNPESQEHLRDGLRKAGLYVDDVRIPQMTEPPG